MGTLLVVMVAYTVGVCLVLWGVVGRPLRNRRRGQMPATPVVSGTDRSVVQGVFDDLHVKASIPGTPPVVQVVPRLGAPIPGTAGELGSRGLAETSFRPGRSLTVRVAAAAARNLSQRALRHLMAHELGHVAQYQRSRWRRLLPYAWVAGLVFAVGGVLWSLLMLGPNRAVPSVLGIVIAYVAGWSWVQRRGEYQADAYAVRLTGDLGAASELHSFYESRGFGVGKVARLFGWLDTHPSWGRRIEYMRGLR